MYSITRCIYAQYCMCVCMSIIDKHSTFYLYRALTSEVLLHIHKNCSRNSLRMVESYTNRTLDLCVLRENGLFYSYSSSTRQSGHMFYHYFIDEKEGTKRARALSEVVWLVGRQGNLRLDLLPSASSFSPVHSQLLCIC